MINLCFIFKSRHLFSYLRDQRCHPQYTKYNTVLLLTQRFIRKVSDNNEHHLSKLNFFLIKRGQPEEVPDYTITTPSMELQPVHQPVHQQVELVGAMRLRPIRTNRSA